MEKLDTLADILTFCKVGDVLTEEIAVQIATSSLGNTEGAEIAKLTIPQLALKLGDTKIELLTTDRQRGAVAEAILELRAIQDLKSKSTVPAEPSNGTPAPIHVTVTPEADKSPKDLLILLKTDKSNAGLLAKFEALPTISKIYQSTYAIAFYAEDGSLDVELTSDYLDYLGKNNNPLPKFKERKPDTLRNVLNGLEVIWYHPLFAGEKLHSGVDLQRSMDWNSLSAGMPQAVLWARLTNHDAFPKNVQVYTEFPKIQAASEHWGVILIDYQEYIRRGGQEQSLRFIQDQSVQTLGKHRWG